MKRVIAIIITFSLFIGLCGCEKYSDYKEIENRFFVSSLGIDETASGITLYAEGAVSNSASEGYKVSVLSHTADTIPTAMDGIKNSTPLSLDLSHCAVIILGKCKEDTERKLGEYLLSKPEDLLSCYFVATDSAKELISCGDKTPIGYSLSYALKKNYYAGGKRTKATLLDIINSSEAYSLPYFRVYKKTYSYSGAVYYSGVERLCLKNTDEARLINLLSGNFFRGQITLDNQTVDIKKASLTQDSSEDSIDIILSLSVGAKVDTKLIENELLKFINEWQTEYRINIFKFLDNGKPMGNSEFCKRNIKLTVKIEID